MPLWKTPATCRGIRRVRRDQADAVVVVPEPGPRRPRKPVGRGMAQEWSGEQPEGHVH